MAGDFENLEACAYWQLLQVQIIFILPKQFQQSRPCIHICKPMWISFIHTIQLSYPKNMGMENTEM